MLKNLNALVAKSRQPVADEWLEAAQVYYNEQHNYYRFLYHLVRELRPPVCLEIGTYWGIGSGYMCAAAKEYGGQVIGVDILIHSKHMLKNLVDRYGNYLFINMGSAHAAGIVDAMTQEYGPLGLVFQDSSHHYEPSRIEWGLYRPLCRPGAVWLCDDITPAFYNPQSDPPGKGMVQYFEELPGEKRLFEDVLHKGNTMGVVLI